MSLTMTVARERWQRVKELFGAALEVDEPRRSAFLIAQTGADEDLQREVASLLDALEREGGRFERPALETLMDPADTRASLESMVGRAAGSYRLTRLVGQGGMGVVYEALRADDQYQKRVAVKMIRHEHAGKAILERFRKERQILARLEHPNIATLLDGGVTEDGQPYVVMEFVEGEPLDTYCNARRLPVRRRLALFMQVCEAVRYAHRNLVVHRDLKPGNILVTPEGRVRLLDFGIATVLDEEGDAQGGRLTEGGFRPLTTAYASPEQVRGELVSTASDVYSLGVVLYELLTGRLTFSLSGRSPLETGRVICEEDPRPPSEGLTDDAAAKAGLSGAGKLRRLLRGDLDNIVMTALRKEPERRYGSVEALAEDVRRHLESLPVKARRETLSYRSVKFVRRHAAPVTAAALAVLVLLAGIAATTWQARVASRERDRAALEALKSGQINAFLEDMLRSPDPRVEGRGVRVVEVLDAAARRAPVELAGQPQVRAAVETALGRTYLGLGLYDEAEPLLLSALETRRGLESPASPELAESLDLVALLLLARGELERAEPLLREALVILRGAPGADERLLAHVLNDYGEWLQLRGDFAGAERAHGEVLDLRRALHGGVHEDVAESLNNLAVALGEQGRFAGAEALHREALSVIRAVKGPEHPDVASALSSLAFVLAEQREDVEADSLFRGALGLRQRLMGPDHPETAWTRYSYASFLFDRGRFEEAASQAREVVGLRGKTLPEGHPVLSSALQVLGRSLAAQGDPVAAEPILRESLRIREQELPQSHWLVATARSILGDCLTRLDRFREAEMLLLQGYAGIRDAKGDSHPLTVEARQRLAALYGAWGRPDEAKRYAGAPSGQAAPASNGPGKR